MAIRGLFMLSALLLVLVPMGCGSEQPAAPPAHVSAQNRADTSISGLYEVTGLTTELETGDQREIAGTIIMAQEGGSYTSTFNLRTMYPTPSGALLAEVIGKGEGTIEGNVLTGKATTQIVMSTVPGVDPKFAFMPRRVSERIVSESITTIESDGKVRIEIRSNPVSGSAYSPTATILKGELVSRRGIAAPLR
jgi:hypothetical protein